MDCLHRDDDGDDDDDDDDDGDDNHDDFYLDWVCRVLDNPLLLLDLLPGKQLLEVGGRREAQGPVHDDDGDHDEEDYDGDGDVPAQLIMQRCWGVEQLTKNLSSSQAAQAAQATQAAPLADSSCSKEGFNANQHFLDGSHCHLPFNWHQWSTKVM